jgi:predicted RNA binding protein YcfA (HicA-like mRNA interferase family)
VPKTVSGKKVVKVLCKHFGFTVVSQRGSHVKLASPRATTIVPNHKELAHGTLKGALRLAKVTEKEFWQAV